MSGPIDLHCHMLPGIDDGAQTLEEARTLLESSVRQGVKEFIFTPHFYPEHMDEQTFLHSRASAVKHLLPVTKELGISFRTGAEIRCTPGLASMDLKQLAFSGTQYLLLELDFDYEPFDVSGVIERLQGRGYTPILAHIERYPYVEEDPTLLYRWIRAGALAQVNAGWVLRDPKAMKQLDKWFRWNLVHLIASDAHHAEYRPQNLAEGLCAIPSEMSEAFQKNARTIFDGEHVRRRKPERPERRWGRWV